jgi:hypothetical protein
MQQQAMAAQAQQQQAQAQHQYQLALAQHNRAEAERRAAWEAQQRQPQQRRPGENARPPQWAAQQPPPGAPRAAPPAVGNQGPRRRAAPPPTTGFPNVSPMASPVSERVQGMTPNAGVAPAAHPVDQHESVHLPPDLRPPPPMPMAAQAPAPQPPTAARPPPMPPQQAVVMQPNPGAPSPSAPEAMPELTLEMINEFLSDLSNAIKLKISPKYFASEFVTKITPPVAKQILDRVTAEQFLAQLEADAEQNPAIAALPILTLSGKTFVKEVFKQTAHLVSGQAA